MLFRRREKRLEAFRSSVNGCFGGIGGRFIGGRILSGISVLIVDGDVF